jgi:hypothetical protein
MTRRRPADIRHPGLRRTLDAHPGPSLAMRLVEVAFVLLMFAAGLLLCLSGVAE